MPWEILACDGPVFVRASTFKEWEISKGWGFFSMATLAFLGPQHTGSIVFIGVTGRPAGLCMSLW